MTHLKIKNKGPNRGLYFYEIFSWIIQKGGGPNKIRPVATWSRYTKDEIDAMILVHENTFWAIPVEEITHRKETGLTLKQAEEMFLKYKGGS